MQNVEIKSFQRLSILELLEKTKQVVSEERRISVDVLHHLREVENRKAFAQLGFKSLFEYAIGELKYSEASAMRRIQAMRALKENPELAEKIESGNLTVSGVARVQSFVRRDEKLTGEKWDSTEKKELFTQVLDASQREIEKTLSAISPQAAVLESVKPINENITEVKIYLTDQDLNELNQLRGLVAHELKSPGSNSELIKKMIGLSQEMVKIKKLGKQSAENLQRNASPMAEVKSAPKSKPEARSESRMETRVENKTEKNRDPVLYTTRYIPTRIKTQLYTRSNLQCEHVDPRTKQRCNSNFKLEIDHVLPFSLGGTNEIENLRILCRNHNELRTRDL